MFPFRVRVRDPNSAQNIDSEAKIKARSEASRQKYLKFGSLTRSFASRLLPSSIYSLRFVSAQNIAK